MLSPSVIRVPIPFCHWNEAPRLEQYLVSPPAISDLVVISIREARKPL